VLAGQIAELAVLGLCFVADEVVADTILVEVLSSAVAVSVSWYCFLVNVVS